MPDQRSLMGFSSLCDHSYNSSYYDEGFKILQTIPSSPKRLNILYSTYGDTYWTADTQTNESNQEL